MKRIVTLVCMLMLLAFNCYAHQQEHIEKSFDFSQAKRVLIVSSINGNAKNGINEFKIEDIFNSTFTSKFAKPMVEKGFLIDYESSIVNDGELETAQEIALKSTDDKKLQEWKEKYDVVIFAKLADFATKVGWVDGYTYDVPEIHHFYYYDRSGNPQIGSFYTHRTEYSPGHNVKYSVERVRFDVYDLSKDNVVWSRIDERAKVSKQGHLYERILKSFFADYKKLASK